MSEISHEKQISESPQRIKSHPFTSKILEQKVYSKKIKEQNLNFKALHRNNKSKKKKSSYAVTCVTVLWCAMMAILLWFAPSAFADSQKRSLKLSDLAVQQKRFDRMGSQKPDLAFKGVRKGRTIASIAPSEKVEAAEYVQEAKQQKITKEDLSGSQGKTMLQSVTSSHPDLLRDPNTLTHEYSTPNFDRREKFTKVSPGTYTYSSYTEHKPVFAAPYVTGAREGYFGVVFGSGR